MAITSSLGVAPAQLRDTASLYGTVRDPGGAVIPGASVTATNAATGVERAGESDASGGYLFSLLQVGTYNVTVEVAGFQRHERRGVLLQANENVLLDVTLQIGDVQTTITVEGLASQIETRTATLTETVDQRRVIELPLDGRNPADLVLLMPGVAAGAGFGASGSNTGGGWHTGQKAISVNGSRQNNLRYTLDGGENMDVLLNFNMPFPFPDAVQEFSAQTSNMGVELGGKSGGVVNVVTKSGTNELHGTAFWFLRNTAMNATNFFSHQEDQLKRNQFGIVAGGPIVKNKLFIFGGYQEFLTRKTAGGDRKQSPTAAERRGDFSQLLQRGNPVTIHDPLNGQPFPNNTIPGSRINDSAKLLLADTPLPDPDGFYRFSLPRPQDRFHFIVRADYVQSDKQNYNFRYFETGEDTPVQGLPNNLLAGGGTGTLPTKHATLGHNYIISPTMLVHTQFTAGHFVRRGAGDGMKTVRDFGLAVNPRDTGIDVNMFESGVSLRSGNQGFFTRSSFELIHDWTWTKGNHSFVWGFQVARKRFNNNTTFRSSGHWEFDGQFTGSGDVLGFDRADFMLGLFGFFQQNNGEFEQRRGTEQGYYFGDTWRVTPRFTLTLGARYEPYGLFSDLENRNQGFDLGNWQNGTTSQVFVNAPPGLVYRGDPTPAGFGGGSTIGRTVIQPDYMNLAPRVGIAWDPFGDGKTSIRAGYSMFFNFPGLQAQNDANNVAPFSYSVEFFEGLLQDPFIGRQDLNRFPVAGILPDAPFATPLFSIVVDNKFITPDTQNWSLTLERELFRDTRLRVAYVGTKATHLKTEYDFNPAIYDRGISLQENRATRQERRILQPFQEISRWMHGLNSTYNSLQASLAKRYSKGFTVNMAYTWSKSIDYISHDGFGGRDQVSNPFNFFQDRSVATHHRPHRFTSSYVWDLPSPESGPAKAVLGDWRFSGILTLQSGRPFEIFASGDPLAGGGFTRVDLLGTGSPVRGGSKGQKIEEYFDRSRFDNPAGGTFGTLGRNAMLGPGYANYDISLVKGFPLPGGESVRGEFRFEAFNLLNSTHLANPVSGGSTGKSFSGGLRNPNFGRILDTDGDPRILQLALKIHF